MESDIKLTDVLIFLSFGRTGGAGERKKERPAGIGWAFDQAEGRAVRSHIGFSQFTIQGMPNLSVNMAKAWDQKVSARAMVTFPPALSSL